MACEQDLLQVLMDNSPDFLFFKDTESRFIKTNTAHARSVLGIANPDEAVGKTDFDFFPRADAQRFYEEEQRIMQTGQPVVAREWQVPTQSEETLWVSEHKIPIRDKVGQVIGIVGIAREVTQRVRAQEALRESEERFRTQYKSIPVPTYSWQKVQEDFVLVDYNDAAEAITRGDITDFIGITLHNMLGEVPQVLEDIVQCFKEKTVVRREFKFKFPATGENKRFNVTCVFVPPDLVMVHTEDITERVRAEEEIRRRSLERQIVSRIARALNTLDVRSAFPVLVEGLRQLTNCDRVSLALPDEAGEYFVMSNLDSSSVALGEGTTMPISATAAAEGIRAGRPHLTTDLSTELDFPGERALYEAGFRSRVNLPLLVGGQVIGALNLASRQPGHFCEDQLPVWQQIADALAIAVANSRLFKAEQRQRQEADTLREAALALTTALDRDEVIERILAQLQQVVPYDSSSVQLIQDDQLVIVGGRGFPNLPDLLGIRFLIEGDNPNREVVRTQAPYIVEDAPAVYSDFRREPHAQAGIRSWLGVPMLVGDRLIGMIALDKREPGFYTRSHARLAEAFAAQAAIAIENARLYEQARQDAETKARLLREVNHRVGNNLTAILGLLSAERRRLQRADQSAFLSIMEDLSNRVNGLATVHRMLSDSQWEPLSLSELTAQVICSSSQMLPLDKQILIDVTPSPVRVTADQAHNLALVINELTTNTAKYALEERSIARVTVRIGLEDEEDMIRFEFRDDGPGYPEEVLEFERYNVGFELIQNTVRDTLRGEVSLANDCGAVAVIRFKNKG